MTAIERGAASGFAQVDHTADLAFDLWAPDEAGVLVQGARALIDVMTEGAAIRCMERRHVAVHGIDRGDRLVRWLNEVLHLAVTHGFLVADAMVTLTGEGGLQAEVMGEADQRDRISAELKAVTYHDLRLGQVEAGQWEARVVVDV